VSFYYQISVNLTFERTFQGDSFSFRTLLNIYMHPSVLSGIKISNELASEIIILLEASQF